MKNRIYTMFDRKLKEYGQLVLAKNDEVVRRMLVDALKSGDHPAKSHPEDFDLVSLGTLDAETGDLIGSTPQLVANVQELLEA